MNDELNVPVQFKGARCIFSSRVPTCAELDTCQHFDTMIHIVWNPDSIKICDLSKTSQLSKNVIRYIYQTKRDTVYTYPIPTSNHVHDTYSYHDPSSNKATFSEISSIFIQLKKICIAQINTTMTATTQNRIRSAIMPLSRRYCSGQMYKLKRRQGGFVIDTFFADMK